MCSYVDVVMMKLQYIRIYVDVAEKVFNRCSVGNESKDGKIRLDSKEYILTFNYEFLEDFRDAKVNFCTRFYNKLFKR